MGELRLGPQTQARLWLYQWLREGLIPRMVADATLMVLDAEAHSAPLTKQEVWDVAQTTARVYSHLQAPSEPRVVDPAY